MQQATAAGHDEGCQWGEAESELAGATGTVRQSPRPASPHLVPPRRTSPPRLHHSSKGPLAVLHLGHVAQRALPKPPPLPHTQIPGGDGEGVPL